MDVMKMFWLYWKYSWLLLSIPKQLQDVGKKYEI